LAAVDLGSLLNRSALRLFIGAGASIGFGLPGWKMLIARVLGKDTDTGFCADLIRRSASDLAKLVDPVDDSSKSYIQNVHNALYRDVAGTLVEQLQQSPLLLAVVALLTGASRGRIDSVVTYNFDDLLEQYLKMLGYAVCCRTKSDELSTRADVEINYPHGRLPQDLKRMIEPPDLVLSERSYRDRRATIDAGWSEMIAHGLHSKIGLFLGMSGDDSTILDVLERVQRQLKRREDYSTYWLLTPDAYDRNKRSFLDVKACPISLEKDEIPKFIFRICQAAQSVA
jgi:hypothetical protein